MSVAAFHKYVIAAPLKIVALTRKKFHPVYQQNRLLTSTIFTITFSYLQQTVNLKVLKVIYKSKNVIYKVALRSHISNTPSLCWLQHQPQGWVQLFGHEIDSSLKSAIGAAISLREFRVT